MNGPTYAEMRDPQRIDPQIRAAIKDADELDPVRLFDIRWKEDDGTVPHWVVPEAITGSEATIVLLLGARFPTGAHKVGAAYSCLAEALLEGTLDPERHTLVFPSTGNYGIGGAWVGPRMGFDSLVVLPEGMSRERFERIRSFGAEIIATPGTESNVKEIYDKVHELRRDPNNAILNQFEAWGNYRFHRLVTSEAAEWVAQSLGFEGPAAFVSAMGSAGTIAAGDALKLRHDTQIIGLEPIQCPTLFECGFGSHAIEGIGDKHVTWIHNVHNMDALGCIDDVDCLRLLRVLHHGAEQVSEFLGLEPDELTSVKDHLGISGMCNLIGAVRTARRLGLGRRHVVVSVATDSFDRYPSVMAKLDEERGPVDLREVKEALRLLRRGGTGGEQWWLEGTDGVRRRWHNQKYFTWVEQQGKTVEELDALQDPATWERQVALAQDLDERIRAARQA